MNKKDLWKTVLADLELSLSPSNFKTWIRPTSLVSLKDMKDRRRVIKIACPSSFHQGIVESRYYGQIKEVLDRVEKRSHELSFVVRRPEQKADKKLVPGPLFEDQRQRDPFDAYQRAVQKSRLRKDFVFDTFAVSPTNEMAYAAARTIAKKLGQAYHLLFLYGGVGVGKTHLMQAVGHEILKQNPETPLIYCTGEEFTNEIIEAIQIKKTREFKQRFRSVSLLLVDDVQFIAGKDFVQEEFFHTFNAIVRGQGQIILTSDKPPEEIEGLEKRLRSRFEGGLAIDIQEPNFELRTAILRIKAEMQKVKLPMDVAKMIAANIESTRKLEGFLTRLISESQIKKEPMTPELAERLLGTTREEGEKKMFVPPQKIIDKTAAHFHLRIAQIKGKRRMKDLATARHVAMYLLRKDLEMSLTEIGRLFGGRDHTTVMHAVEKISSSMVGSERLRNDVGTIRKLAAD